MKTNTTILAGLVLTSSLVMPMAASAQSKHHHLKTWGTGIGAYALAKQTGKHRRHKNIFQRHPMATGIGAGLLMKHHLKKHG